MKSISKYDFFIRSVKSQRILQRKWILSTFSVAFNERTSTPEEYDLFHDEEQNNVQVFLDGEWQILEGPKFLEIPYVYHEVVPLVKKGDITNALEDIKSSTWGEMLFNERVVSYAARTYIPYVQHPVNVNDLGKIFAKEMLDDPEDGQFDESKIYVRDLQRLGMALQDLGNYEMFIPSLDRKGLSAPPNNEQLKDELFAKYADQLDDPVIQTKIQDELIDNYKAYLKGSPSEGFIYKPKSINTAIKRMFLLHGVEDGFGGIQKPVLIKKSLDQGLDTSEFPMMVNSLRNGAYSRGALTQLAGAGVNLLSRMFQNSSIDIETTNLGIVGFCGTTATEPRSVHNRPWYLGRYAKINGKPVAITQSDIDSKKILDVYTPKWCKAPGNDVCRICIGDRLSQYDKSLGTVLTKVPSTMMDKMMGSAHAKEQVLVRISEGWLK